MSRRGRNWPWLEDQGGDQGEDPGRLESDGAGTLEPYAHPSLRPGTVEDLEKGSSESGLRQRRAAAAEVLTPEDRATDTGLALSPRRWRVIAPYVARELCPLCGSEVPAGDWRARARHVEWHKDLERTRAACGLPPGHVSLTVDYARLHERARRHAGAAVGVALALMFLCAVLIVVIVL